MLRHPLFPCVHIALFSLALCLPGCAWSAQTAFAGPQPVGAHASPQASSLGAEPEKVLQELEQSMIQVGYQRAGPAQRNPLLAAGNLMSYQVTAQGGQCYVAVVLGRKGTNPNLVVRDPQGQVVGHNVLADPYPWATFCADSAGRFTAVVQMDGSQGGDYLFAVYAGPSSKRPDLSAFFGGKGNQSLRAAALDDETKQRLAAMDKQLAQRSFQRLGEPQGFVFRSGQQLAYELHLGQNECYAFASLGGPGASNTDLFLVDGLGAELQRDTGRGQDATLEFCATQAGQYKLLAQMTSGQGALFTASWTKGPVGGGGQQTQEVITQATAAAGLEENFQLLDTDMRSRGYELMGKPARSKLEQSKIQEFPIALEGGRCYAVLAVGDNGVRDLDVMLVDANGTELDRDIENDSRPTVRVCPKSSGNFKMRIRMYNGRGNFIYASYRWPRGVRGPFGLNGLIYVRLAEVSALLGQEGYEPDLDYTPERGKLTREGASKTHRVRLAAGQCYAVLVVGGEGVHDLAVRLSQGSQDVVKDLTRTAFPNVRYCPDKTESYTLHIKAEKGKGDYFYQVLHRTQ